MSVTEIRSEGHVPLPAIDMLREANHRISNHLTLLVVMIQSQANALANGPATLSRDEARALLREAAGKIVSVGHLHRRLADRPGKSDINLCDYLVEVCATLVSSLALGDRVRLVQRLTANCLVTPEQAQQIGLMVSEIIMNAVKHAHPTGIPVQISLACRRAADGRLTIEIGDDGVGLPEGADSSAKGGVGFRLIHSLAQSLNADLSIESDSLGLTFLVTLPAAVKAVGIAAN